VNIEQPGDKESETHVAQLTGRVLPHVWVLEPLLNAVQSFAECMRVCIGVHIMPSCYDFSP